MMPKRIQMSRQHPWRADNLDAVIVARPGTFGNPFKIGVPVSVHWYVGKKMKAGKITAENQAEATAYHMDWMNGVVELDRPRPNVAELVGRDVACWCGLGDSCHGDNYLTLANPVGSLCEAEKTE